MLLKKLDYAAGVDTFNLDAKRNFVALKAEVNKLDINKLIDVLSDLNNLKTKVHDLDVDKLKTVHMDLKKIMDIVSKKVVKNTKFNKLNMKVSILENKISDATTLILINQYNIDKQTLGKKLEISEINYQMLPF